MGLKWILSNDNVRLTESGNARSEQQIMMYTESLINREWMPGECLSGSVHKRPGCSFRYKYRIIIYCVSALSLHTESIDSMIKRIFYQEETFTSQVSTIIVLPLFLTSVTISEGVAS